VLHGMNGIVGYIRAYIKHHKQSHKKAADEAAAFIRDVLRIFAPLM
jgi:hypothetical protein